MAIIRNLVVKIGADISSLSKGLKKAESSIQGLSRSLTGIGQSLTMSVTMPLALMAGQAVNTAAKFEQSMANAASVSGATGEELEKMTEVARQMGRETVFSASEAADALYYMASAGYKSEQMAESIQPILNLASATQNDLAFTTDTVIASLNQFGLEATDAERVTNVFASVIGNSQATLDKLAYSMRYVGPVANSLGYSIEETSAALGLLYNSGFKGEQAGTILRGALSRLLKPTSEMEQTLVDLGVAYDDVNPSTNSLSDIIKALEKSGIDTAQAIALFGMEAGPGMMAMIGQGSEALEDMTEKITDTNAASDMAQTQIDTMQGSAKIMQSMMQDTAITIGNILIPMMRELMEKYLMPITEKFQGLSDVNKETAVKIGMVAAAIGPLFMVLAKVVSILGVVVKVLGIVLSPVGLIVIAIVGLIAVLAYLFKTNEKFRAKVLDIWDNIKKGIVKAIAYIKEWWTNNGTALLDGIASVFNSIVSVITACVAVLTSIISKLISSIMYLWENNREFGEAVVNIWNGIRQEIASAISFIISWWKENGQALIENVIKVFNVIWEVMINYLDNIIKSVTVFLNYLAPIWEQVKSVFSSLWELLQELYTLLEPLIIAIGSILATLLGAVIGTVNGIIQALGPLIQAVLDLVEVVINVVRAIVALLSGDLDGAFTHMQNAGQGMLDFFAHIWEAMQNFASGFVRSFIGFFESFGVDFVAVVKDICNTVGDWFSGLWQGITDGVQNIWNSITGVFGKIGDFFADLFKQAYNWGANLIQCIVDGINASIEWVGDSIKGVGQKIKDFLGFSSPTKEGPGSTADEWMPNMMQMFASGIKANLPDIEGAVSLTANSLSGVGNVSPALSMTNGDMLNGLFTAMNMFNKEKPSSETVELNIDGQTFARVIMPSLNREFRRTGIKLGEI